LNVEGWADRPVLKLVPADASLTVEQIDAEILRLMDLRKRVAPPRPVEVLDAVEMIWGVRRSLVIGPRRLGRVVEARHAGMVLVAEFADLDDGDAAAVFRRSRTDMTHARTSVRNRWTTEMAFRTRFDRARKVLGLEPWTLHPGV